MAIYSLQSKPASRSNGKSAVAMAAYRSGGRLIDERTGQISDYSRKKGVIRECLIFPEAASFDRQTLWNMAEKAEKRKDARIAREIMIALPHEISEEQRIKLAMDFADSLVKRYGIAVDVSVHEPDRDGDERNFHAHLLLTTRQIERDGLGSKSDLEKSDRDLKKEGKPKGKDQLIELREAWENLCNKSLERNGREERISAKSYKERGIDLEPSLHMGPAATEMERKGIKTELGESNREIARRNLYQRRRRFIRHRINRLRKEIQEIEKEIKPLENELKLEREAALKIPREEPREARETIKQPLPEKEKLPEKEQEKEKSYQEMSASDLLNRYARKPRGAEQSISDLMEKKADKRDRGIDRKDDGIER